jgi:hypothetical protein
VTNNSEEKKDHVELREKSAQKWLKLRRYTDPVADLTEQDLKQVLGRDGLPCAAGEGNGGAGEVS